MNITATGIRGHALTNVDVYDWSGRKIAYSYDNRDRDTDAAANRISLSVGAKDVLVCVKRVGMPDEWTWKRADAQGNLQVNTGVRMLTFAPPAAGQRAANSGALPWQPGWSVEVITAGAGTKRVVDRPHASSAYSNDFDDRANVIDIPLAVGSSGELVVRDAAGFTMARYRYGPVSAAQVSVKRINISDTIAMHIKGLPADYRDGQRGWQVLNLSRTGPSSTRLASGAFLGRNSKGQLVGTEGEWQRALASVNQHRALSAGYLDLVVYSTDTRKPPLHLFVEFEAPGQPKAARPRAWAVSAIDQQIVSDSVTAQPSTLVAKRVTGYPGLWLQWSDAPLKVPNGSAPPWVRR